MFILMYIAILLVTINAQGNIKSSEVELSTNRKEEPVIVTCFMSEPIRRNQPCRRGEKMGPNGKCRKRW